MSLNGSDSVLWIGTINGLARLQDGNWKVYQQDSTVLNANDDIRQYHLIQLEISGLPAGQCLRFSPVIEVRWADLMSQNGPFLHTIIHLYPRMQILLTMSM